MWIIKEWNDDNQIITEKTVMGVGGGVIVIVGVGGCHI